MKAIELDAVFDENATDIIEHLDLDAARRPRRDAQRVNVDFPAWMVASLDAEATRLGITRQAVIKTWIAERLDRQASLRPSGRAPVSPKPPPAHHRTPPPRSLDPALQHDHRALPPEQPVNRRFELVTQRDFMNADVMGHRHGFSWRDCEVGRSTAPTL